MSGGSSPLSPYRTEDGADASLLHDRAQLEAEARHAFDRWARQLPMSKDAGSALRQISPRAVLVGRLRTELAARALVWREAPYPGDEPNHGAAVAPSSFDPFAPPEEIRQRSRHLSQCTDCAGSGQSKCRACEGAAKVSCGTCNGQGKQYGIAANGARRMLNCKICKGKATLPCTDCRKGKVPCSRCDTRGRVERWLAVENGPRDRQVVTRAKGDPQLGLSWANGAREASEKEIRGDASEVCAVQRERKLELSDLPAEVPSAWRDAPWKALSPELGPGERIASQAFTLWSVPMVDLTYAVGEKRQTVTFEGRSMVAPHFWVDQLFRARATKLRWWMVATALLPLLALILYSSRGSYFVNGATAGLVLSVAALAGLLFGEVWSRAMHRPSRRWRRFAVLPALAALGFAWKLEPSASTATDLVRSGQLDLAERELKALGDPDEVRHRALWDELWVKRALAKTSCEEVVLALREVKDPPAQAMGRAHADTLALRAAAAALDAARVENAEEALACATPSLIRGEKGTALRARILLFKAKRCLKVLDWRCARTEEVALGRMARPDDAAQLFALTEGVLRGALSEKLAEAARAENPRAQLPIQRAALEYWGALVTPRPEDSSEIPALQAAIEKNEAIVAKLDADEARKRAAEEKLRIAEAKRQAAADDRQRLIYEKRQLAEVRRQAAAEERAQRAEARRVLAAERAEQRREAARDYSPLLCNDGTLSPTCTCGRSSYRGCCSYHGGVDGCSAD